jgi:hypothetical protein
MSASNAISSSLALDSQLLSGTGSVGFTTTGSFTDASSSLSARTTQIESVYATTGSNSFRATQSITGSLTVTGQIIAQTLNVQQVTSSIVYSSGSNVFGCDINSRQTFTGSFYQTGSIASFSSCVGVGITPIDRLHVNGNIISEGCFFSGAPDTLRIFAGHWSTTSGNSNCYLVFQAGGGSALFGTPSGWGGNAVIYTCGQNRLTIGTTGVASFSCQVCSGVGFYASSVQSGVTIDSTANGDTIIASRGLNAALHGIVRTVGQNGTTCMMMISTRNSVDGNLPASVNALWGLTNNDMVIASNNTERARITSTGIACFACQVCAPRFLGTFYGTHYGFSKISNTSCLLSSASNDVTIYFTSGFNIYYGVNDYTVAAYQDDNSAVFSSLRALIPYNYYASSLTTTNLASYVDGPNSHSALAMGICKLVNSNTYCIAVRFAKSSGNVTGTRIALTTNGIQPGDS